MTEAGAGAGEETATEADETEALDALVGDTTTDPAKEDVGTEAETGVTLVSDFLAVAVFFTLAELLILVLSEEVVGIYKRGMTGIMFFEPLKFFELFKKNPTWKTNLRFLSFLRT
jgi:hypothetical protein